MSHNHNKKKRDLQQKIKKIIIQIFVWLIIVSVVATIGVYMGNQPNVSEIKIAKIGKETYKYKSGSAFSYLYNNTSEQISSVYGDNVDREYLNDYILSTSVQKFVGMAMVYQFSKKIGVEPSPYIESAMLQYLTGGNITAVPPQGLLRYIEMQYANDALMGQNGEVAGTGGLFTMPELYLFLDMKGFQSQVEILSINMTNYIVSKLSQSEIQSYYDAHASEYATMLKVEEMVVDKKALSYEIQNYLQEHSWEDALSQYQSQVEHMAEVKLINQQGTSKRFQLASGLNPGDIAEKPQFEDGHYHIIRLKALPEYKDMDPSYQRAVAMDYVRINYKDLKKTYLAEVQTVITELQNDASKYQDWSQLNIQSPVQYDVSFSFSPVDSAAYSLVSSNRISLPLLKDQKLFDFCFGQEKGSVSKVIESGDYYSVLRIVNKTYNAKIGDENLNVAGQYQQYKKSVTEADWFQALKEKTSYEIYDEIYKGDS